jgi:membrane protein YqaA with SNARE-associated domain
VHRSQFPGLVLHTDWQPLPQYGLSTVFVFAPLSSTLLPLGSEPVVFGLIRLNPPLPGIGEPLSAVAGWLRLPFWPCLAWMAIGKFARYVCFTALLLWAFPSAPPGT